MTTLSIEDIQNYIAKTKLEREVKEIILNHIEEDYVENFFEDLLNNGCISGMIGELIYYKDTLAFFERHKEDITELLYELLDSCGFTCPNQLFGDSWDKEDPLALETTNQNLLAWFAFEEVARNIAWDLGLEL